MKDFLLQACVVVRISNVKICRLRLAGYVKKIAPKSVRHVQHDYFSSFNQSNLWFVALTLPSLSPLSLVSLKPGFHIIAPIAPMAPIARNSVQAIRAIHCFHMIARKFYSIVLIARIEQSSIWAITIVPVAPIVPQLSVTVSI